MSDPTESRAVVYVVDDDRAVRDSLELLLGSVGLESETFESAREFLQSFRADRVSCLVADIRMPGMSGLELKRELNARRISLPVIFITGHGDVPMAVSAMKDGAVDFLTKPFKDWELLECVRASLRRAEAGLADELQQSEVRRRFESLTPREVEVMRMVVRGSANKVIAMDLGVSQRTVELHRARVMQKMAARSLAELVRFSELLD